MPTETTHAIDDACRLPIRCGCGACFGPTAANYVGSSTMSGLYMILVNCACGSTRALVLHDDAPELDSEAA